MKRTFMLKKDIALSIMPEHANSAQRSSIRAIMLCTIAFVLCILLSVAPLSRLPITRIKVRLQIPPGTQLAQLGAWLPNDVGMAKNPLDSQGSTNYVEFLLLIAVAFAIYGLCAFFIQRQSLQEKYHHVLHLIWLGAVLAGCIYIVTPALLSTDIFVYASYSRLIVTYHANPFFVPLSVYPHDPFYPIDHYAQSTAVYGPVWLGVCTLFGLFLAPHPLDYVLAFRLFAFVAHLVNILLVTTILRKMDCSPRTVALGTLLYAWNPLVLIESSLSGHNDIFMVTFLLLGILLSIRAEQRDFRTLRNYLPPLLAFTLAAMVKFTALPVLALFIIWLACKVLRSAPSIPLTFLRALSLRWRPTLLTLLSAGAISLIVALTLYAPLWIGHNIQDIANSFSSSPSAQYSQNSIMRAIAVWNGAHPLPAHPLPYDPLYIFSFRSIWNYVNLVVLAVFLIIGCIWLWKAPDIQTFILATLATLGALLLITPWFFSWYVIWLVALAAVCLPATYTRIGRALLAFTLVFSASALLTYLFKDEIPPFGKWMGLICLITIGPPLLAFFSFILQWRRADRSLTRLAQYSEKGKIGV